MNSVADYFYTNWQAMTLHDWLGLGITIIVFLVMLALYAYVLHPANRDRLEAQRHIPLEDDQFHMEEKP